MATVLVTHRSQSVRLVDRVYSLEKGLLNLSESVLLMACPLPLYSPSAELGELYLDDRYQKRLPLGVFYRFASV